MRILLALTILLAFSAVFTLADKGSDSSEKFGDDKGGSKRKLTYNVNPHTVRIVADRANSDQKSRFAFEFTTNGFPRLRLARYAFDETNDLKTAYTFRIGFRRVIEFIDSGNNCFDLNDDVKSQLTLIGQNSHWSNIQRTDFTVNDANTNQTVNATKFCTTLTRSQGVFTLCIKMAAQNVFDGQHTYGPRRIKIDIRLDNYDFNQPDGTSKLALIAFVYSKTKATNETAVPRTLFFDQSGAFDWDGVLNTDIGPMAVHGSTLLNMTGAEQSEAKGGDSEIDDDLFKTNEVGGAVAFCIDNTTQAAYYDWDPATEISDSPASTLIASFFLPLVLACLALFAMKN